MITLPINVQIWNVDLGADNVDLGAGLEKQALNE